MLLRERQEIKTLALIISCYGIWGLVLFGPVSLPVWLMALLLIPTITFHSSLQHECIHGHPFIDRRLNDLIVSPPIGLFLPYPRFKELHLTHHLRARITNPTEDPESWYITRREWANFSRFQKLMRNANNILVGRMIIGPALSIISLIYADFQKIRKSNWQLLGVWTMHLVLAFTLLVIIENFSNISIVGYLIATYFSMSLLMIRTFLEHQAHPDRRARSVLIDDKGLLRFLFLNNNLHAVHHAFPSVAWYRLPGLFRLHRDRLIEMNKGYFYKNYTEVFRAYGFVQKEPVVYPLDPV
ncbi:fatty acid desaturase [Sneathiella litorea]|uniref:Fatty acid desaturase n=1 Tax=Sneathiella litorea TaxID=2606216 RepID=A0A6L8W4N6_9PROT|nr:fatty acid desaturase [Sneathiella litorea]MZR29400.1 fatty acid desaturase [Sneathiella litorea]